MKLQQSQSRKSLAWLSAGLPFLLTWGLATVTWANPHTTIVKKNTPDHFSVRHEQEGSSGVLSHVRISHGCNGTPVRAMGVVFPNGVDSVATKKGTQEEVALDEHIVGVTINAHPIQDRDVFRKSWVRAGEVLNVGNGVQEGVRGLVYTKGHLEDEHIGLIPFDASFPRFQQQSCAVSLQVNMAIANYCTHSNKGDDRADIWIGHFTPLFDDPAVVVQSPPGFWPQLTVVRDLENNPIPANCSAPLDLVVTPASHEIDEYLPIHGFWPAK